MAPRTIPGSSGLRGSRSGPMPRVDPAEPAQRLWELTRREAPVEMVA